MIGIIFDCDGTLIESEHAYYLSWQEALKARGSFITLEEYSTFIVFPRQIARRYE